MTEFFHFHLQVMDPSRVFLTANQPHVPWSHLVIFPARKGEISFLERPWIWQHRLMKSDKVHLQSLRKPGVNVLTFQVDSFRQGISFCCMVQICQSAIGFHPNPTHPVRLTGRGGAASYWQGATLRLAVTAQWDVMTSHTVRNNPWRHALRKSSRNL